jgi:hypothetical protein
VRSAPGTAEWFARVAGAAAEPLRETVLEPHPVTGIWAERLTWGPARGAEVVLLTVHGGGHVVHGPGLAFPPELGPLDPRLDVLEEALRFFERQPPAARRRAGAPARPPQQACGLAGESFTTTMTLADAGGDPVTAGRWRIAFAADGRFTAEQNGAAAIEGSYDVRGDLVTFRDEIGTMACEGRAGTYSWRRSGERLELGVVEDVCPGRVAVFTAHPLRRDVGAGPVSSGEP